MKIAKISTSNLLNSSFFIIVCTLGCFHAYDTSHTNNISTKEPNFWKGLERTLFDEWEIRSFNRVGLNLTLPKKIFYSSDSNRSLFIQMHPMKSSQILSDVRCLLEITFERKTENEFQADMKNITKKGVYKRGDAKDKRWWLWYYSKHPKIDMLNSGQSTYYRLDIDYPNGDVLKIKAELSNIYKNGSNIFFDEDNAAIRRILESIELIERN